MIAAVGIGAVLFILMAAHEPTMLPNIGGFVFGVGLSCLFVWGIMGFRLTRFANLALLGAGVAFFIVGLTVRL